VNCLARPCVTCKLGAGTGIRTQLEGSTVPQDNHYPIPARHNGSLLRGDKTFPAIGSPGDIHHQRNKILQSVDVVNLAQTRQSFLHVLIPVSLVDAEEHEIACLASLFYVIPFLVEVLDMRVGDAQDQAARVALWVLVPIFGPSMERLLSRTTSRSGTAAPSAAIAPVSFPLL
jgi:hypothetical protein